MVVHCNVECHPDRPRLIGASHGRLATIHLGAHDVDIGTGSLCAVGTQAVTFQLPVDHRSTTSQSIQAIAYIEIYIRWFTSLSISIDTNVSILESYGRPTTLGLARAACTWCLRVLSGRATALISYDSRDGSTRMLPSITARLSTSVIPVKYSPLLLPSTSLLLLCSF